MTEGARLLDAFIKKNDMKQAAAGKALSVSDPTISDWISGHKRPRAGLRKAIEVWSNGEIPADSWETEGERKKLRAVRPFDPTAGELAPTGTDKG